MGGGSGGFSGRLVVGRGGAVRGLFTRFIEDPICTESDSIDLDLVSRGAAVALSPFDFSLN